MSIKNTEHKNYLKRLDCDTYSDSVRATALRPQSQQYAAK